ncbi:hypothetical protein phiE131_058 [Burkholderia phage phiE131]|nr:hypothetical protein phiE131_058 [Burkholderia phage phiE131]AYJ74394.1 hypothetical protein phiE058_058 [Burkholderia phage phiE058]
MKQTSGVRMRPIVGCAQCGNDLPAFRHWLTRYCNGCRPSHSKEALSRIQPPTEPVQVTP